MCNPILDDFWNDSQRSCNACGGYWPFTQPGNCHDKSGKDLTMCGCPLGSNCTKSPTNSPTIKECVDALPTFRVYEGKTCAWITNGGEKNMAKRCNKSSKRGVVYDLCPLTCAKVGLGPCATSQDTFWKCSGCLKLSGDCNNDDYEQGSCERLGVGFVWCGWTASYSSIVIVHHSFHFFSFSSSSSSVAWLSSASAFCNFQYEPINLYKNVENIKPISYYILF